MSMAAQRVERSGAEPGLQLEAFLPLRLSSAADVVSGLIARTYQDRFGLSISEWRMICLLAEAGASTLDLMSARSGMEGRLVRQAAAGLASRSLVRVSGSEISLSDEGRRLQEEIAPMALAYEAALTASLSPAEVATLKRLLSRLQSAARSLAGEPAA